MLSVKNITAIIRIKWAQIITMRMNMTLQCPFARNREFEVFKMHKCIWLTSTDKKQESALQGLPFPTLGRNRGYKPLVFTPSD